MPNTKNASFVAALLLLAFLFWHSARSGYAARLTTSALEGSDINAATTAVKLSPNDAQAQLILGALFETKGDRASAISHYRSAVAARPRDYVLRMQLARAEELEGEIDAAINSARVAVRLAPAYAKPHWQLGNMLVRAGQSDQGLAELRLAGNSNASLLPAIIDLAWQVSRGDVESVKLAVSPQSPRAYIALAEYFRKRGKNGDAVAMLSASGTSDEAKTARAQMTRELINANDFNAAYQLWTIDAANVPRGSAVIIDPGFEQEGDLSGSFGWQAMETSKSVTLNLDGASPKEGRWSLRAVFNGETSSQVISQLLPIEPNKHYALHFAVRTEGLVSGGLPKVSVLDANGNKLLGEYILPQTTDGWRENTIDFNSGEQTTAIRIALQRATCATSPCPIFGRLWLDAFDLRKAN